MLTPAKHIVITGASSGLGAALAREYAESGIVLGLLGRNEERLEAVAKDCAAKGALVKTAAIPVHQSAVLHGWLEAFDQHYPIDLCIANAGISGGPGQNSLEDLDDVQAIFDTNVIGVMNTLHPVAQFMIARNQGHIAVVSSLAGFRGVATAPAYSTSKVAIKTYAETLRPNLKKHGISVTVICPGFIQTPLTDKNNFPMPFLMTASQAASLVKKRLIKQPCTLAFPTLMAWIVRIWSLLPLVFTDYISSKLPRKN